MMLHKGETGILEGEAFMQQVALAQWAHDIRNALSTVALCVETLERLTCRSRRTVQAHFAGAASAAA